MLMGLEGWCNTFHHSTEYLIITVLTHPTIDSKAQAFAAFSESSIAERSAITLSNKKN
jgi:acetyl-CoA carboxylase beta subunit